MKYILTPLIVLAICCTCASAQTFTPTHRLVMEDQTICATGFGIYCPRGIVRMESFLNGPSGANVEVISVHSSYQGPPNDAMTVSVYANGCLSYPNPNWVHINAWPEVMIDRKATTAPDSLDDIYALYSGDFAVADITVSPMYNPGTRALDVTAKVHFAVEVLPADPHYNLALVLTEDSVHGTTINYAQRNAYANGANGDMASSGIDFVAQDDPVPADLMYYLHVARAILPSYKGKDGSLPGAIHVDSTYSYTFPSYKIPATYRPERMRAIVLLIDTMTGNIKNANGVNLSTVISGVHEDKTTVASFNVSPNPFHNETTLNFSLSAEEHVLVRVSNVLGQDLFKHNMGLLESGGHSIVIDGENLAPGTYFATLKTDQGSFTKTIVVNK